MSAEGEHRIGDVVLNYRLTGDGPERLVCIHGVGASLDAWNGVLAHLGGRFTVLTFDLRGHGRSSKVKGRYEIDDFADEALALADHVGFTDFHLAGFSLGGLIAQQIALAVPGRVRSLILLSTVAGRNAEERDRVMARLEALKGGERGSHYDASVSRWFSDAFRERHPEILAAMRRRNAENDPECYAAAYRVLAETDLGDALHDIRVPTLIATGEFDMGSNSRMAAFMHGEIAGSELRILPNLRHSILIEAPEIVGAMMRDFLEKVETTNG
ncbi:MAG: alpha/beta fold hydrolase [Rhizobiales bacterium]|nr:alpha/beta fold hydrolase [Hyphomicrobiales bacterium]OJY02864.1 MAG: alpha/beta hydrolase [Rhizobiales bacterium 63-22]